MSQQIFIELYQYKPAWHLLSAEERRAFSEKIIHAVRGLEGMGAKLLGFGHNSADTDRRATHDFFCVYELPNAEFNRQFEQAVEESGWYEYFDQVNLSGKFCSPEELFIGHANLEHPA